MGACRLHLVELARKGWSCKIRPSHFLQPFWLAASFAIFNYAFLSLGRVCAARILFIGNTHGRFSLFRLLCGYTYLVRTVGFRITQKYKRCKKAHLYQFRYFQRIDQPIADAPFGKERGVTFYAFQNERSLSCTLKYFRTNETAFVSSNALHV